MNRPWPYEPGRQHTQKKRPIRNRFVELSKIRQKCKDCNGWVHRSGASLAGQIAEIAVSLGETAVESHTMIEERKVPDVMWEQYDQ